MKTERLTTSQKLRRVTLFRKLLNMPRLQNKLKNTWFTDESWFTPMEWQRKAIVIIGLWVRTVLNLLFFRNIHWRFMSGLPFRWEALLARIFPVGTAQILQWTSIISRLPCKPCWTAKRTSPIFVCHINARWREFLTQTFGNRVIDKHFANAWPAQSPDLTPADYYLMPHLKIIM